MLITVDVTHVRGGPVAVIVMMWWCSGPDAAGGAADVANGDGALSVCAICK